MLRLFKDVKRISKDPLRRYWWLYGLFRPARWTLIKVYNSDETVDEFIWESLNAGYQLEPDNRYGGASSEYTVVLNGRLIWISNFPFASGSIYESAGETSKGIAFYETRIRLQNLVERGIADGTLRR